MLAFLRRQVVRRLVVPPILALFMLTSCGVSDQLTLGDNASPTELAIDPAPGQLLIADAAGIVSASTVNSLAVSDDPEVQAMAASFRELGRAARATFGAEARSAIEAWAAGLRDGGPRRVSIVGQGSPTRGAVLVSLTADSEGILRHAMFQDSRGSTSFDLVGGASDDFGVGRMTRRDQSGAIVFAMDIAGGSLQLSPGVANAEEGSGPCWLAVWDFFAALAIHEGGAYILALGIGGFIALGPVAMAAIVVTFLGTAGMVGSAAAKVYYDCGLGQA